jgi:hypothetical protein
MMKPAIVCLPDDTRPSPYIIPEQRNDLMGSHIINYLLLKPVRNINIPATVSGIIEPQ